MKFIRLAALFGSLVLLVATAVSVLNRRGDLRNEQETRVEQSTTLASLSVRNSIARASEHVDLLSTTLSLSPGANEAVLARELATVLEIDDVCIGSTSGGCIRENLLALETFGELAAASERTNDDDTTPSTAAQVGVDDQKLGLLIVRRVTVDNVSTTVAVRLPAASLVDGSVQMALADAGAEVSIDLLLQSGDDQRDPVEITDGNRLATETIGSGLVDGSVVVTSSVDGSIGIVGDEPARYGLLLALGTVLLALAGWTFLVERRQLERRATTDELTGLINRREFERVSEAELDVADRFNSGLCVMVVDLNGFKQVNDTLGHQFGDLVLAASSERLVAAVRDTDVVGRWGGDEFVILLPGLADRGAVRKSAERIWHSLAGSPVVGDTSMTASIGAAIFPRHGVTLDSLMRAADVAMYEAKTTGVSHRIADTIIVSESLLDTDGTLPEGPTAISTEQYAGPDRRHSPVPPPPVPGEDLAEPVALPRPDTGGRLGDSPEVDHDDSPEVDHDEIAR